MITRSKLMLGITSLALAAGCSRSPEQDHAKAAEAQRSANEQGDRAQREANEKILQAKVEGDLESARAQAKANDTIREADREMMKSRNDVREWSQKKTDEIDTLIDEARAKAQKATPQAKVRFNEEMRDVQARQDALRNELASLESQSGADLTNYKSRIEKEIAELRASVSHLESTI